MPLTWNAEKCSESALTEEERDYTAYFCYAMMAVGINHLKANDVDEFYWRLSMVERLFGCFWGDTPRTKEFVELRVGYSSNANSLTRNQFLKSIEKRWFSNSDF